MARQFDVTFFKTENGFNAMWVGEQLQQIHDLPDGTKLKLREVTEAGDDREAMEAAMNLLYMDSHNWSTRPCATCREVSKALNISFGCVRKAKEAAKAHARGEG